jgi:hypothetical protein
VDQGPQSGVRAPVGAYGPSRGRAGPNRGRACVGPWANAGTEGCAGTEGGGGAKSKDERQDRPTQGQERTPRNRKEQ